MATKIAPPHRILVKEVNWLGDAVMSLAALRAIRDAWPDAHLAVLIRRELAGLFEAAPWIDEVIPYSLSQGRRVFYDTAKIVSRIRHGCFDLAILFPNSFSSALWVALAGVPIRAGYIRYRRGLLLTHGVAVPADSAQDHQSRYWLAMTKSTLGIDSEAQEITLDVRQSHRERMRQWLRSHGYDGNRPLIALAPSAAYGPAKEWPVNHYSELTNLLAASFGAECVLVGAPHERGKCEEVAQSTRRRPLIAAGETEVGELIALLSLCDGFVGNDSGCAHVSAALGVPTVTIFGSTDPRRSAPVGSRSTVIYGRLDCSPCFERVCPYGHTACLVSIGPAEVIDALRKLDTFTFYERESSTT
jgi:heptosyltransferase-2